MEKQPFLFVCLPHGNANERGKKNHIHMHTRTLILIVQSHPLCSHCSFVTDYRRSEPLL